MIHRRLDPTLAEATTGSLPVSGGIGRGEGGAPKLMDTMVRLRRDVHDASLIQLLSRFQSLPHRLARRLLDEWREGGGHALRMICSKLRNCPRLALRPGGRGTGRGSRTLRTVAAGHAIV